MLPPLPDPREARGHTLPQPWGHHESHGALLPPWPHCPGATKCTYPGAALPANRGGSAPRHPTAHVGLHGLPPRQGGNQGGSHKGMPGVTPLPCARTLPALLGCPPPQPWQRRTPSSQALPPTTGKTLHQMVLNPGSPPPHPGLFLLCTQGGLRGRPQRDFS